LKNGAREISVKVSTQQSALSSQQIDKSTISKQQSKINNQQ
jgi:hypothetical protein